MFDNTQALQQLVAVVGDFYLTDKSMKKAQDRITDLLARGQVDQAEAGEYVASVRRYFSGFEREAREHLRSVDKRLEHINQVHFNLTAERGVAVRRIEATQAVLHNVAALEQRGSAGVMKVLEDFGKGTTEFAEYAGGVVLLGGETIGFIARLRIRVGETLNQAYLLGLQSLIIVLLTSLFTGMVFSLESAQQAVQYGVGNLVGGAVAYTSARELGPMLSAVVVAGRVGAAIAAEIGSMVVTEQIEALQSLGLAPARFLVVPRLLALMIMLPLLAIFADVVSIVGGMWIAQTYAHIGYESFISSARQTIGFEDVVKGLVKSVVFAVIIVLVGAYQGLGTRGGAAGVGQSTTGAVVTSIILIFISNFVMSYILYGGSH